MLRRNKILLLSAIFALSACSSGEVKRSLGLSRNAPDEFMVIARPPLSVPPDFRLNPPADYAASPNNVSAQAKEVLFPEEQQKRKVSDAVSNGEYALLQKAGTDDANPDIRRILIQEQVEAEKVEEEKGMLDSLRDTFTPSSTEPTVNVDKEEDRISKNLDEGNPLNEGEVPTNETTEKGIINQLID